MKTELQLRKNQHELDITASLRNELHLDIDDDDDGGVDDGVFVKVPESSRQQSNEELEAEKILE